MVDYSKWVRCSPNAYCDLGVNADARAPQDALELSDDSDVEVHPNVDKRSFIRAKQNQIRMERQQRKLQIEALKHERIINDALMQRLRILVSALQSHHNNASRHNPADMAFQTLMELASSKPDEERPPPRPEGTFHADSPPLPSYPKMIATLLDEVNKTLDGKQLDKDQRYEAFLGELGVHLGKIQDLQADLVEKLDALEQQDSKKITSENYHVGFDSSHVNKAKQGEASQSGLKVELLNPNCNWDEADPSSGKTGATKVSGGGEDGEETVRASPAAKKFAQIQASNYRVSQEYISSHPEILRKESDTDGLMVEAYRTMLDQGDEQQARQYVHQALLLQYCRVLGRDGVALFFKRVATPGHQAHEVFQKDVAERFHKIRAMAWRDAKQQRAVDGNEAVEQVQLYPVGQNSSIRIQVPPAESEDEEVNKARSVFEQFAPDMRAALESGSLDKVNKVLGEMDVSEAEKMVSLLDEVSTPYPGSLCCLKQNSPLILSCPDSVQAGCLSIEDEIVDATTEEGKMLLRDIEKAALSDAEPMSAEQIAETETAPDPK
jgi:cell division cycle protein 37